MIDTLAAIENQIKSLQESISKVNDWNVATALHVQLTKCIELHVKMTKRL